MKIKEIRKLIEADQGKKLEDYLTEEGKEIINSMQKDDANLLKKERKFRNFQRLVLYVFIVFFIIWLLFFLAIGLTSVPNEDMRPAFHGSDVVIFDKMDKHPGIDEVAVFNKNGTTYVGRVIAREGDKVEILKSGGIKINDSALIENYIYSATTPLTTVEYPLTLGEGEYFILTDNRESGEDSRYFGPVKQKEISGTVVWLIRRTNF